MNILQFKIKDSRIYSINSYSLIYETLVKIKLVINKKIVKKKALKFCLLVSISGKLEGARPPRRFRYQ